MKWADLVMSSGSRPGMYVRRPYVDGLVTLWFGFSLGSGTSDFEQFSLWAQTERFPAEGGHKNPLSLDGILRRLVTGDDAGQPLSQEQDDRAVELLVDLAREFAATRGEGG